MCFRASTLRSDAHTVTPVVIGRRCVRLRFTMAKIVTVHLVRRAPDPAGHPLFWNTSPGRSSRNKGHRHSRSPCPNAPMSCLGADSCTPKAIRPKSAPSLGTHDFVVQGCGLGHLFTELAAQRVTVLKRPIRADRFEAASSTSPVQITTIEVHVVQKEA
jgi:hypothetical protein